MDDSWTNRYTREVQNFNKWVHWNRKAVVNYILQNCSPLLWSAFSCFVINRKTHVEVVKEKKKSSLSRVNIPFVRYLDDCLGNGHQTFFIFNIIYIGHVLSCHFTHMIDPLFHIVYMFCIFKVLITPFWPDLFFEIVIPMCLCTNLVGTSKFKSGTKYLWLYETLN